LSDKNNRDQKQNVYAAYFGVRTEKTRQEEIYYSAGASVGEDFYSCGTVSNF